MHTWAHKLPRPSTIPLGNFATLWSMHDGQAIFAHDAEPPPPPHRVARLLTRYTGVAATLLTLCGGLVVVPMSVRYLNQRAEAATVVAETAKERAEFRVVLNATRVELEEARVRIDAAEKARIETEQALQDYKARETKRYREALDF